MTFDLTTLPDYPSLQQLARALWRDGSLRGAAALVGAGFSKNASCPGEDTPRPPSWPELLTDMAKQLYPTDGTGAPTNALRLAEEYRTYFGQAALDDYLRTRLPDRAWQPGELHGELLELPWADVLTTNWDTLLERASERTTEHNYELVRFETDLPHARSPRIVKLHGTLGDAGSLVFAEEDYRRYPHHHAAYVNLARQVFIENDLCLLGFSGEDPNYLQWAGWVRDQLSSAARRIYLVGHLNLARATRKFLEAHNIAPIDFAPAVAHMPDAQRHATATQLFLEAMRLAKPVPRHEWQYFSQTDLPLHIAGHEAHARARTDDAFAADLLSNTSILLKSMRLSYPGWLVCPFLHRISLLHGSDDSWLLRPGVWQKFDTAARAELLHEYLWRRTTGLRGLEDNLREALISFLEDTVAQSGASTRLEFAVGLLRDARLTCDDDSFERWHALIEHEASPEALYLLEAQYQRCLRFRDRLDFAALSDCLKTLKSDDPVWQLRRAALHCDVGEESTAVKLIDDAVIELDRRLRLDRSSLWIKSRLGWASWLLRLVGPSESRHVYRDRDFRELNIDPHAELHSIEREVDDSLAKQRESETEVTPLFEVGHYRQRSSSVFSQLNAHDWTERQELDILMETVGLPLRVDYMGICSAIALKIAQLSANRTVTWYTWLLRSLHSHYDTPFDRYFSRVAIAQMPNAVCAELIAVVEKAMEFWRDRLKASVVLGTLNGRGRMIDQLRLYVVTLSRLTVRMDGSRARTTFERALEWAADEDLHHPWILEALGKLMEFAAQAMPNAMRTLVALHAIEFPLADEVGVRNNMWPSPVQAIWSSMPERLGGNSRWDTRIQHLIRAAAAGQPSRQEAVYRLAYLALRNALSATERGQFANALWSERDAEFDGLPARTNLMPTTFLELPVPEDIDAHKFVRQRLLALDIAADTVHGKDINTRQMSDKVNRLRALCGFSQVNLPLLSDEAVRLFEQLTAWTPSPLEGPTDLASGFHTQFNNNVRSAIGELLSKVIVPTFAPGQLTKRRGETLLAFIGEKEAWGALPALPYFLIKTDLRESIKTTIRRALVSLDSQRSSHASLALITWAELAKRPRFHPIPHQLIDQLITTIEARQERGLQMRLRAAGVMSRNELVSKGDARRLDQVLEDFLDSTDYRHIVLDRHEAVSASLIRAECVRLAQILESIGLDGHGARNWLQVASGDPLPEVRFGLDSMILGD